MSLYKKLTEYPIDELIKLINENTSKSAIVYHFGFKGIDPRAMRYINSAIEEHTIDISHFSVHSQSRAERRKYTVDDVKTAVINAMCMVDVLRYLGLSEVGGNATTIKKIINDNNISTDHFCISKTRRRNRKQIIAKDILIENSSCSRSTLRQFILREKIIPYQCYNCGNTGEWMGKKLTLDLDHKNGDRKNNKPSNLRFACPNCHSQTSTFRGRNNKGKCSE